MGNWPFSEGQLRAMYQGGRANAMARRLARVWATVFASGVMPKRWVCLEVTGRSSGRVARFPLGMARADGQWYLVSMLGDGCNWVQNVRAADGNAILRRRHAMACSLIEVPPEDRAPMRRTLGPKRGRAPEVSV